MTRAVTTRMRIDGEWLDARFDPDTGEWRGEFTGLCDNLVCVGTSLPALWAQAQRSLAIYRDEVAKKQARGEG